MKDKKPINETIEKPIKWTLARILSAAAIVAIIGACIYFGFMFGELFGKNMGTNAQSNSYQSNASKKITTQDTQQRWWQKITPDVIVGDFEYYAGNCSILQVNTTVGTSSAKTN